MTRVLIAGVPRSGTTWIGECLGSAPGAIYVHEPDNPESGAFAVVGTSGLWSEPDLVPGQRHEGYELLWHVGAYFDSKAFLTDVPVRFTISEPTEHYHVPLLVSPWSYTVYRGS